MSIDYIRDKAILSEPVGYVIHSLSMQNGALQIFYVMVGLIARLTMRLVNYFSYSGEFSILPGSPESHFVSGIVRQHRCEMTELRWEVRMQKKDIH